ncbi:D-lyxose/D-mannose family sugar isomerase [Ruminococcaceae bacterium OttesenSCG-928-I18]|nr:D-lyxose/D-mannose family sugar isomerase [Ruminococcaceae bacterium OttesenSCG-928-I18]
MKRSEINKVIKEMEALLEKHCFQLPAFCHWTPADWEDKSGEYDEIRDNMLGWDVTDYGMGKFDELGLALITLRNGNPHNDKYKKPYAEKIIMVKEGQVSPMHFHWLKMEDIINRGGGNIVFRLFNATKDGEKADTDVEINKDGRKYRVKAGSDVVLKPGESMTLYPYYYHEFIIEPGSGATLIGEVSTCNDDEKDNRFYEELGRFPTIEEDEPPYRLLCTEYPKAK